MTAIRRWSFVDGALLVGLVAFAILAMLATWADIFAYGTRDSEQSHVLLAPVIVAWLFWMRRERLRYCAPSHSVLGPLLILASWGIGEFGFRTGMLVLEHFSAVGVLLGAALTVLGPRFFLRFFPAAFAALFVLPIPGMIRQRVAIPLQEVTAQVAHWILEVFGAPVVRQGNLLSINGQDVAVAEACNGMRMAAALVVVAYVFAFSRPLRTNVRILIILLSPVVAVICNVIRLIPSVLLYGYADAGVADAFHDISGWAILVVAFLILWSVGALLRWLEVPIEPYAVGRGWSP